MPARSKNSFKDDLASLPISYLVSKCILERIPYIFDDDNHAYDNHAYINWKEELAKNLGVDSRAIIITGSAGSGFSLNPIATLTTNPMLILHSFRNFILILLGMGYELWEHDVTTLR